MTEDINVLALVKGNERYVFLYDDASRAECLRVLGRFASNPDLSFTWYDAAVLSQRIRQVAQKQYVAQRFNLPSMSKNQNLYESYNTGTNLSLPLINDPKTLDELLDRLFN